MNWGALIAGLAAAVILVLAVAMTWETVDLLHGRDPVTNGVRARARAYPKTTFFLVFLIGLLFGHLFWN